MQLNSNQTLVAIRDNRSLNGHEKFVLLMIISRIGNKDHCFPSIKTLAKDCDCSMSTIQRTLNTLEEKLYITRKKAVGLKTNKYFINEQILFEKDTPKPVKKSTNTVTQTVDNSCQNLTMSVTQTYDVVHTDLCDPIYSLYILNKKINKKIKNNSHSQSLFGERGGTNHVQMLFRKQSDYKSLKIWQLLPSNDSYDNEYRDRL